MKKISFQLLNVEVDKLYDADIPHTEEAINEHIDKIKAFINAAGYTEEEYLRQLFASEKGVPCN